MAGRGDSAHGSDRASSIAKYDGLPGKGKLIVEEFNRPPASIPVLGSFVSTMESGGVDVDNPILRSSNFGDSVQKPKFAAKITLFDAHGSDNF